MIRMAQHTIQGYRRNLAEVCEDELILQVTYGSREAAGKAYRELERRGWTADHIAAKVEEV